MLVAQGTNFPTFPLAANNFQETYTTPGSYLWTPPYGVKTISIVCVGAGASGLSGIVTGSSGRTDGGGGGALAYINEWPVQEGQVYRIVVGRGGAINAGYAGESSYVKLEYNDVGGQRINGPNYTSGITTATSSGNTVPEAAIVGAWGGGNGRNGTNYSFAGGEGGWGHSSVVYFAGGNGGTALRTLSSGGDGGGGGGAAGYAGVGGNGTNTLGVSGSPSFGAGAGGGGGGGGNSVSGPNYYGGGGGGGVGIKGQGSNGSSGQGGSGAITGGQGGSNGTGGGNGGIVTSGGAGGSYGGGGGGGANFPSGAGGGGAVRIMYASMAGTDGRRFPANTTAYDII